MKKLMILLIVLMLPITGWAQFAKQSAGSQDSIGVDYTGDAGFDAYIYPAFIREGANITLSVVGDTLTITGTGSGTPGGSDTQIQYNDGGSFGGIANFTWDDTKLTAPYSIFDSIGIDGSTVTGLVPEDSIGRLDEAENVGMLWTFGSSLAVNNGGTSGGFIDFYEDTDEVGSNYLKMIAPVLAGNITLTLPTTDGDAGQYLKTDGSGVMSWDTPGGSGDMLKSTYDADADDSVDLAEYSTTAGSAAYSDSSNVVTDNAIAWGKLASAVQDSIQLIRTDSADVAGWNYLTSVAWADLDGAVQESIQTRTDSSDIDGFGFLAGDWSSQGYLTSVDSANVDAGALSLTDINQSAATQGQVIKWDTTGTDGWKPSADATSEGAGLIVQEAGDETAAVDTIDFTTGLNMTAASGKATISLHIAAVADGADSTIPSGDNVYDFCETTQDYLKTSENSDSDDDVTAADVGAVSANLDDTDASIEWEDAGQLDASGNLDITSQDTGSILYYYLGWKVLPAGTDGYVLQMDDSIPTWAAAGADDDDNLTGGTMSSDLDMADTNDIINVDSLEADYADIDSITTIQLVIDSDTVTGLIPAESVMQKPTYDVDLDDSVTLAEYATTAGTATSATSASYSDSTGAMTTSDLVGQIADTQIADGAVDGGNGGEIADSSITDQDINFDSVTVADFANDAGYVDTFMLNDSLATRLTSGEIQALIEDSLDEYAPLASPTFTGVIDAGGATSLEVPNGASPAVTVEGQIAYETDQECFVVYDGADTRRMPTLLQHEKTIFDPDGVQAVSDAIPIFAVEAEAYPDGIRIVDCGFKKNENSNSYVCAFELWDDPSGTDGTIETITSTAYEAEDNGTIDSAYVPAGSIIYIDLDTDDEDYLQVWFTYYIQ